MTIEQFKLMGSTADVIELGLEHVVIEALVALPPGKAIELSLEQHGEVLQAKVRNCRRVGGSDAEPRFRIEARFRNLTRAQRRLIFGEPA